MLDELLQQGWQYHDTESERLADELESVKLQALSAVQAAALLKLANHTVGEHLADWPRACRLARRVWASLAEAESTVALAVPYCVAEQLGGNTLTAWQVELSAMATANAAPDAGPKEALSLALEVRLAMASALVGSHQLADGAALYESVLSLAPTVGSETPLVRALAVSSNNMAGDLMALPTLSNAQQEFMRRCGDAALDAWRLCGTWENEERALYLLQLICMAQLDHQGALEFAEQALAIIQEQGPEPIDQGFILLARSASLWHLRQLTEAKAALSQADALAAQWPDAGLKTAYAEEKRKLLSETGMLEP